MHSKPRSLYNTVQQYNKNICIMHGGRLLSQIWGVGIRCAGRSGYTLRVVREVRCVLSRRLKLANVLDSLSAASNSFQIVGVEKLKERLLKLVVQEGTHKRFRPAERRWHVCAEVFNQTIRLTHNSHTNSLWICMYTWFTEYNNSRFKTPANTM